jgi:hypothetical protein
MARAQAANVAAATGQQGASGFQGGMTALQSQLGANLGYGGIQSQLGQQYTSLTGRAAQLQGQGQLFGQLGQMAFGAVPYAGQISSMGSGLSNAAGAAIGIPKVGQINFS